jgi:hypothetical protein
MKKAVIIACMLSISITACSDSISATDVPSVVLNSFKSKFPEAMKVEWEKVDTQFEAEFKSGNTDHAARLTADGRLIIHKKEIEDRAFRQALANFYRKTSTHIYLTILSGWKKIVLPTINLNLKAVVNKTKDWLLLQRGSKAPQYLIGTKFKIHT